MRHHGLRLFNQTIFPSPRRLSWDALTSHPFSVTFGPQREPGLSWQTCRSVNSVHRQQLERCRPLIPRRHPEPVVQGWFLSSTVSTVSVNRMTRLCTGCIRVKRSFHARKTRFMLLASFPWINEPFFMTTRPTMRIAYFPVWNFRHWLSF